MSMEIPRDNPRYKRLYEHERNKAEARQRRIEALELERDGLLFRLEKAEEALRKATTKPKAERRAVLQFHVG